MKQTPFYSKHVEHGGRMVEFAGHELPVQFHGIIPEHTRVRTSVGVFDVSHMARFEIRGSDAHRFADRVMTNDFSRCAPLQAQYTAVCYPDGGIVDDMVIYNLKDHVLMVMNGANYEKDLAWLRENRSGVVEIIDRTAELAQLAIQGPQAEAVLQKITDVNLADIKFYWANWGTVAGTRMLISRTGYTGEDGFELYIPVSDALKVWDAVFAAGREHGIEPIGLGARDTLRLEVKLCLYGNDIDRTTNPLEAVLGFVTKLDKPDGFIGSDALKKVKAEGIKRKLIGFEMSGRDIPRPHCDICRRGAKVGTVTSGTMSPSLRTGIGMGYVAAEHAAVGSELEIDIRGRKAPAAVVTTPFYKNGTWKKG